MRSGQSGPVYQEIHHASRLGAMTDCGEVATISTDDWRYVHCQACLKRREMAPALEETGPVDAAK